MIMSETPRTDEFYWRETGSNPVGRPVTEWAEFARTLERELAAMTAEKELAERQVAVMCTLYDRHTRLEDCAYCPAKSMCPNSAQCVKTLAAWSRAEAKKGGKG
jgi:hypothetical protein